MHTNYSYEVMEVHKNLSQLYIGCEFEAMAHRNYSEVLNLYNRTYEDVTRAAMVSHVAMKMAGEMAYYNDMLAEEYDLRAEHYRTWKADRRRIRGEFQLRFQRMMNDENRAYHRYWRPVAPWHYSPIGTTPTAVRQMHWHHFDEMRKLRWHAHPRHRGAEMRDSYIDKDKIIEVDEWKVVSYLNNLNNGQSVEYAAYNNEWLDSGGIFRAECGHFTTGDDAQYSSYHDEHACGECGYFIFSEYLETHIRDDGAVALYSTESDLRHRRNADWVPGEFAADEFRMLDGEYVTDDVSEEAYYEYEYEAEEYEDEYRDNHAYNGRRLLPYHSNAQARKIGQFFKPDGNFDLADTLMLGLEMEFIVADDDTSIHVAGITIKDALNQCAKEYLGKGLGPFNYCCAEEDGSLLDDNDTRVGFELITGYGPISSHRLVIGEFFNDLSPYPELMEVEDTSDRAGIHVHISDWKNQSEHDARLSPLHRGKLSVFIHSPRNSELITAVARRGSNTYAIRVPNKKVSDHQREWIDSNRYEGVSFAHPNTVEFRIFANSTKASDIITCLEFTHAAWRFTKEASIAHLTTPYFIDWLNRKDNKTAYATLRLHLYRKGYTTLDLTVVPITISQLLAA